MMEIMMMMMMMMTIIIIIIIIIKFPRGELFGNRSEHSGRPVSKCCPY